MAATSTSSDPAAAASSTVSEGPVLSVISKRLRAFRKKYNRILQMEDSLSQGKTLNKEQQEVLRSKPVVLSLIDELEKLRSPLASAINEEVSIALAKSSSDSGGIEECKDEVNNGGSKEEDSVKELLNLMYFGSLFDVKQQSEFTSLMLTRTHERGCCLTYDYVTDDATDLLVERDLDLISALQGLMISRPVNSPVSHQNALEKCVNHAKLWLSSSDQPINSQSDVTYAALREKLKKIMASDYFTATPHMKGPGEVAAAAGVGNFGSFEVPMTETMVPVEVSVEGEGSVEQYSHTEENSVDYEEYEVVEHQSGDAQEIHQDGVEADNPPEVLSSQTEQEQLQAEEDQNSDFKEQQYIPRRGPRGGRGGGGRGGGGRRGYPNGRGGRGGGRNNSRGGGPYQNGRSYQYYDNYYQPRSYHNRRGGRGGSGGGGSGGGDSYYNHSSAAQGNHAQAEMGVSS